MKNAKTAVFFRSWPHLSAALVLLAAHLIFYGAIFSGGLFFGSDAILTGYPVRTFAHDFWMAKGRPPFWNPYIMSGAPYLGNFVAVAWYPINALLMLLPPHLGLNLVPLFHSWLGASAVFACVNLLGLSAASGMAAALAFSFSGLLTMRLFGGHFDAIAVIAWAPVIFFFWLRFLACLNRKWLLAAALALAMQILAGYPQYVYLTHIPIFFVSLYISAAISLQKRLAYWVLYLGLGLLVSAVQWWPALIVLRESVRSSGLDWSYLTNYSLPLKQALTFFIPNLFGDGLNTHYTGAPYMWETTAYFGLSATLICLLAPWRKRSQHALLLLAGVLFLLALGGGFPGFYKVYVSLNPLQKIFRAPARFITPLFLIGFYFLALGVERVVEWSQRQPRIWQRSAPWALVALLFLDFWLAHGRFYHTTSLNRFHPFPFDFGHERLFSVDSQYKFLTQAPMHRQFHVAGREAMLTPAYNRFLNTVARLPLDTNQDNFLLNHFDPLLGLASVRWVIVEAGQPQPPLAEVGKWGRYTLFENPNFLPRAFFVNESQAYTDEQTLWQTMRSDPKGFRSRAWVKAGKLPTRSWFQPNDPPRIEILEPDRWRLKLPKPQQEAFLVVTQNNFSGWSAYVDGRSTPIYAVNAWMQGVLIPAGAELLELTYSPRGLTAAVFASILGILLIAALWFCHPRRISLPLKNENT